MYSSTILLGTVSNHSSIPAANPLGADGDIVVPKRVCISAVRLPAKVDARDLWLDAAPLPLRRVGVRDAGLAGEARDGLVVEPRLERAVGAQVVLEALPAVGGQRRRRGDALRRQVRQRRVVRLAVEHEDLALAAYAEVLLGALRRVGHGDEGDVRVGQGAGCFAVSWGIMC